MLWLMIKTILSQKHAIINAVLAVFQHRWCQILIVNWQSRYGYKVVDMQNSEPPEPAENYVWQVDCE